MPKIINSIFGKNDFPGWIIDLNCISLIGIVMWPIICLVSYARLGDSEFAQLSKLEYLLIIFYPLILIIITALSFKLFNFSKIIAAILPVIVILFYFFRIYRSLIYHFNVE